MGRNSGVFSLYTFKHAGCVKPLRPRVSKTVRSDNTMRWDSWEFLFLELVHGQGLWRRAYAGQCKPLDSLQTPQRVIIFKLLRLRLHICLVWTWVRRKGQGWWFWMVLGSWSWHCHLIILFFQQLFSNLHWIVQEFQAKSQTPTQRALWNECRWMQFFFDRTIEAWKNGDLHNLACSLSRNQIPNYIPKKV